MMGTHAQFPLPGPPPSRLLGGAVEELISEFLNYPNGVPEAHFAPTEQVDHPDHYQGKTLEAIDIIEDFDLNFNLGNVVKYVLRAGKKDSQLKKVDLEKALNYLERELNRRED